MIEEILFIGGDHYTDDYDWIMTKLEEFNPDAVTMELTCAPSLVLKIPFDIGGAEYERKYRDHITTDIALWYAGIIFALKNNKPLYFIDDYFPSTGYWDRNLIDEAEILDDKNRTRLDRFFDSVNEDLKWLRKRESTKDPQRLRRCNTAMGNCINRLHDKIGYNRFAHLGGSAHIRYSGGLPHYVKARQKHREHTQKTKPDLIIHGTTL